MRGVFGKSEEHVLEPRRSRAAGTLLEESSSGSSGSSCCGACTPSFLHAAVSLCFASGWDVDDMMLWTNQASNSGSSHCAGSAMKESRLDHPWSGSGEVRVLYSVRRTPTAADSP